MSPPRHSARLALLFLLVAAPAPAGAQVPGTGGDPIREAVAADPAFVDTELPALALWGGNPEDTTVLFDGFEVPWIYHPGAVRSLVPPGSLGEIEILPGAFGVEYGRGSSVVNLSSGYRAREAFAELTPVDLTLHSQYRSFSAAVRGGWNRALRGVRADDDTHYYDAIGRWQWRLSERWALVASVMGSLADDRSFTRGVLATHYKTSTWHAVLAASVLSNDGFGGTRTSFDTRAEVIRTADRAAGLTNIEWRIGQQTNSSHWDLGDRTLWTHDVGVWSSLGANLSSTIRANVGLRADDFDGHVALQPRAQLTAKPHESLQVMVAAGAYRRPPEQPAELGHDLEPERATQLALGATFAPVRGAWLTARTYYIDRTHLVAPDQLGVLHNSGFGTSRGVELIARGTRGAWTGQLGMALSQSTRFDYPRALEHPAPYEQPFRLDALASWKRGGLVLSARLRLASGLPYTPYTGAIYDSDTDTYEPLYVPPLSARTPFHHQIDLRADYRKRWGDVELSAFIDLYNAYRNRDAIGYDYSYDYASRTAITALPLFPFVGLRATL
jgi:hypothetical protein